MGHLKSGALGRIGKPSAASIANKGVVGFLEATENQMLTLCYLFRTHLVCADIGTLFFSIECKLATWHLFVFSINATLIRCILCLPAIDNCSCRIKEIILVSLYIADIVKIKIPFLSKKRPPVVI